MALHRSSADMAFLSAIASAVAEAEPDCTMLLTADDGAGTRTGHSMCDRPRLASTTSTPARYWAQRTSDSMMHHAVDRSSFTRFDSMLSCRLGEEGRRRRPRQLPAAGAAGSREDRWPCSGGDAWRQGRRPARPNAGQGFCAAACCRGEATFRGGRGQVGTGIRATCRFGVKRGSVCK